MNARDIAASLKTDLPAMDAMSLADIMAEPAARAPGEVINLGPNPSHRQRVSRRIFYDFSQVANAVNLIKELPGPDETIHCVMDGTFNGIALVPAVIELAGQPVDLTITTLGFNLRNIECLIELSERKLIKKLSLVCCIYFEAANPHEYQRATQRFATIGATLKANVNHSKILLFDFGHAAYVAESSANLRSCNNLEQFSLTNSRPLLTFHANWINKML